MDDDDSSVFGTEFERLVEPSDGAAAPSPMMMERGTAVSWIGIPSFTAWAS